MLRPFSAQRSTQKTASNPTHAPGAVPVVLYLRHGTNHGCRALAEQQEKALSFLSAHATRIQTDPRAAARSRIPTRPTGRQGNRHRRPQE